MSQPSSTDKNSSDSVRSDEDSSGDDANVEWDLEEMNSQEHGHNIGVGSAMIIPKVRLKEQV